MSSLQDNHPKCAFIISARLREYDRMWCNKCVHRCELPIAILLSVVQEKHEDEPLTSSDTKSKFLFIRCFKGIHKCEIRYTNKHENMKSTLADTLENLFTFYGRTWSRRLECNWNFTPTATLGRRKKGQTYKGWRVKEQSRANAKPLSVGTFYDDDSWHRWPKRVFDALQSMN